MTSSLKIPYVLLILALAFVLTGCELARNSSEAADTSPLEALPPTLAPLGSEESAPAAAATPVPTVLSAQPTATASNLQASQPPTNAIELVAPTAQPPSVPAEPAAGNTPVAQAPAAENPAPVAAQPASEPAIITDAPASQESPQNGPIAANPPVSESSPVIPAASSGGTYIVQAGDTLFGISQRYGTTVDAIVSANGLNSDMVQIGQTLTIPTGGESYAPPAYGSAAPAGPGGSYVVGPNDTLFSIAMRYGTTVEAIAGANNIAYPFIIHAGQTLTIPAPGYMPNQGYPQQPPAQQPGQGYYPQQPPADGSYQQPGQGYYPQQPPANGYYQPNQGNSPQQSPADGSYQQPDQGYGQPGQGGGYYPAPGYGAPTMPGQAATHTVAPGETLYSIARRYGVSAEAIAAANGLANPNQLFVGQVLYLP